MLILMGRRERSAIKYVRAEAQLAVQLPIGEVTRKFLKRNAVTGIGYTSEMLLITEGYEALPLRVSPLQAPRISV
jgi:hypothetical protein